MIVRTLQTPLCLLLRLSCHRFLFLVIPSQIVAMEKVRARIESCSIRIDTCHQDDRGPIKSNVHITEHGLCQFYKNPEKQWLMAFAGLFNFLFAQTWCESGPGQTG